MERITGKDFRFANKIESFIDRVSDVPSIVDTVVVVVLGLPEVIREYIASTFPKPKKG